MPVIWLTAAVALLTVYLTLIRYAAITVAIGFAVAACWGARQGRVTDGCAPF